MQGTRGKGLGSVESLDRHWGPLDKVLNEFYEVHGHVLVITDPECSVAGLSTMVRRSVVARAYREATGRIRVSAGDQGGLIGDTAATVVLFRMV